MCDLGGFGGLEIVDEDKILEKALESVKTFVEKLDAVSVKGGYYPVILSGGFCGTIFHEACGHGLEASAVAYQKSVFYDKLGQKVGSSKVTLIDDGTLKPNFGYVLYDSEGHLPQKNVLIENGILKSFLIDKLNGRKMGMESSGSRAP
ncbi:MAG: metallopeptidase TldD-related protein [Bacilli bacterium]